MITREQDDFCGGRTCGAQGVDHALSIGASSRPAWCRLINEANLHLVSLFGESMGSRRGTCRRWPPAGIPCY